MSQHNKYYMSDRIDVSNKKENRIIENNESNTYNTCFIIKLYFNLVSSLISILISDKTTNFLSYHISYKIQHFQ